MDPAAVKIRDVVGANISENLMGLKDKGFTTTEIDGELLGPKQNRISTNCERETG